MGRKHSPLQEVNLTVPEDRYRLGDLMDGELYRSKSYEQDKKRSHQVKKAIEEGKVVSKLGECLESTKFRKKLLKSSRKGQNSVCVLKIRSKYLKNDVNFVRDLNEVANRENLKVRVYNIYMHKMDSVASWIAYPHKIPIVFRGSHQDSPNPDNINVYTVTKDKNGVPKVYGVMIYVTR